MNAKRLRFVLLAIPVAAAAILTVAAHRANSATAAPASDPSCSSPSPCIQYQNTGSGPAIRGISTTGNGVSGEATVNSTSPSKGRAGVIGSDNSTSSDNSFNTGVKGTSTFGTGVAGTSVDFTGVSAVSTSGDGLIASSTNGEGISSTSTNSVGAYIFSTNSYGLESGTEQNSSVSGSGVAGVYGYDFSSDGGQLNLGVKGTSQNGIGVLGSSDNFVGVNAVGGYEDSATSDFYPALSVVGDISNTYPPTLINACPSGTANPCDENNAVFDVGQNGNVTIAGEIYTSGGSCCIVHSSTKQGVRFYTPRETLPTVEDFGEAQLTTGHAYVSIDPAFSETIDQHATYMVSITPEGDSRGLYVTSKTLQGFEVRENQGGQSTLAFSYRIVAKPYGESGQRLQRFTIHVPRPGRALAPHVHVPH
jgi:hypothetical protein